MKMDEIVFVTHNKGKIQAANKQLKGVNFKIFEYELEEPRSDDIKYISEYKVKEAFKIVNKPCVSLDCGFWIDELNGFPRAFVNFMLDTIGLNGILKLMENKNNRSCKFTECLSYYDGKILKQFMGQHPGKLSKEILGNDTSKKWSDLWYIFIPYGSEKTLAEMDDSEREIKRKINSIDAMEEFAKWYIEDFSKKYYNVFLIHSLNGNTIESFAGSVEKFCKENNIEYYYPIFPLRAEASPESWEKVLDEYRIKGLLNSNSLVITHSIGTKFIPKYVAKYNINIDTFVSVAGFVDYVGRTDYLKHVTEIFEITDEEYSKCKELIKNRFAIYSNNDNNSPIEKCVKYADKLAADKILVEGAGHFTIEDGITEIDELNTILDNYIKGY